jgi:hypothetical protein
MRWRAISDGASFEQSEVELMVHESETAEVAATMRRVNDAWLHGQLDDLEPLVHPKVTMALPGWGGRMHGRDAFIDGFRDFCQNATVEGFHEHDHEIDLIGDTAVVTFRYEMIYRRLGDRRRATGRDLWVFAKQSGMWVAIWRTMLDLAEQAVDGEGHEP